MNTLKIKKKCNAIEKLKKDKSDKIPEQYKKTPQFKGIKLT